MNFPADWQNKPLGSVILDIGDGGTPNTNKSDYFGGPVPWVVIQDIKKHITSTKKTLTELGLNSCSAKLWPVGAVILSTGATIGEVGIAEVPLATKQGIHGIVCSNELSSEFLYYKLSTLRDFLRANAQGSTIREVRAPFIRTIPIAYPTDKTEQSKIAEVLSTVDRAIEQTEALIAKQQRIKTGLMQDLLTKGIDAHGNIRSEATHAFKDSLLGWIPVEWGAKLLDDCVRPDSPICYGILMPGTGVDDGVPVIKVKDIFDGAICLDDILLTDPKIDAAYKRSRLRANDLLITIRGTTGRVALVPSVLDGANITQDTARIRLKDGYLPIYFFYLLQSAGVQAQVDLQTMGQAVKGINIAEVRKLRVAVPPEDEQKRICQLLKQIHAAWQASVIYRDKLLLQKAGMMKDLLTGERCVTALLAQVAPQ